MMQGEPWLVAVCSNLLLERTETADETGCDATPVWVICGPDRAFVFSAQSDYCRKANTQGKNIFDISLGNNLLYAIISSPHPKRCTNLKAF